MPAIAEELQNHPSQAGLGPAGQAVVVLDRGRRVLSATMQAFGLLAAQPALGEEFPLCKVVARPHAGRLLAAVESVLNNGKVISDLSLQLLDGAGSPYQGHCSLYPLSGPGNAVTGVMLLFAYDDFSLLARGWRDPAPAAAPSALGFQALFEHLAEGVFTINTRWRITSFNRTAERITGYRREEVLGRHCWEVFRSNLCETGCPLRSTLESGQTRMDQDLRMMDKAGEALHVLVNTSVVRDAAGGVVGGVESFRSIADQGQARPEANHSLADIVGAAPPMQKLFGMLPDIAASEANVLIQGESGTGKELFARAIHNHSSRGAGPFVAVNCSALAEDLLESELFGQEKAGFGGEVRGKVGRFELARGGTLFLDEIGHLKPELQVKLLRVLEQKIFERVGGTRPIPMQARIISATNRDLKTALAQGAMREDLFYRLRTVPLTIPPLRRRPGDIPLLVRHFMEKFNLEKGMEVRSVEPKVMSFLQGYSWPGNVRELARVMEHAFVFVKGPVIMMRHLPALEEFLAERGQLDGGPASLAEDSLEGKRREILEALRSAGGKRARAAAILGISRTSLWRRMKRLGLA